MPIRKEGDHRPQYCLHYQGSNPCDRLLPGLSSLQRGPQQDRLNDGAKSILSHGENSKSITRSPTISVVHPVVTPAGQSDRERTAGHYHTLIARSVTAARVEARQNPRRIERTVLMTTWVHSRPSRTSSSRYCSVRYQKRCAARSDEKGQQQTLRRRRCGVQQLANRPSAIRNAKRRYWRPRAVRTSFSRSDDVQFERSLSGNVIHPSFR
jgi:hypothetical protein